LKQDTHDRVYLHGSNFETVFLQKGLGTNSRRYRVARTHLKKKGLLLEVFLFRQTLFVQAL
jgi:hypothetical protein